jgi:hypothetical protein
MLLWRLPGGGDLGCPFIIGDFPHVTWIVVWSESSSAAVFLFAATAGILQSSASFGPSTG